MPIIIATAVLAALPNIKASWINSPFYQIACVPLESGRSIWILLLYTIGSGSLCTKNACHAMNGEGALSRQVRGASLGAQYY